MITQIRKLKLDIGVVENGDIVVTVASLPVKKSERVRFPYVTPSIKSK
jgi:hypothetical protein